MTAFCWSYNKDNASLKHMLLQWEKADYIYTTFDHNLEWNFGG